jgi:hypothetical protein
MLDVLLMTSMSGGALFSGRFRRMDDDLHDRTPVTGLISNPAMVLLRAKPSWKPRRSHGRAA